MYTLHDRRPFTIENGSNFMDLMWGIINRGVAQRLADNELNQNQKAGKFQSIFLRFDNRYYWNDVLELLPQISQELGAQVRLSTGHEFLKQWIVSPVPDQLISGLIYPPGLVFLKQKVNLGTTEIEGVFAPEIEVHLVIDVT